jgi:dipeptidyl-peptidase-4
MPSEGFYLGQVSWAGNSEELLVEKLSRFRDKREFLLANVNTGTITTLFEESDPAWVVASYNVNGGLEWINNYSAFVVLSEKDGWRHAWVCSRDGSGQKLITPGNFDVIERVLVDDAHGWFYYIASPDNGTQKYLFRVRLNGKGQPERISPMNQPGTHSYSLSSDAKRAFHTYSTANKPPVTNLVELPLHEVVMVLEDNKALQDKMISKGFQQKEFLKIDIGDGIVMDAWMIKPHDFDPSRKYPVFVYVYGEPHGQTVMDTWGHAMADYHRVIADLGYLVVSIDNRGTPCPKGAAWRRAIAGSLGPLSTDEQAAALKEMGRTRSYVDLSRVGIWGWSGGGSNTLNAMFRKSDLYAVGIAVAPKPQPHLYNAWFQEIYMKTREVNPEGYRLSAPINYAEGLKGELLIVHGSGETNTHLQITEGLVDRLIELGKPFDFMVYPNRDHGIRKGTGTSLHLRVQMARYLLRHLPPGPR